MLNVIWNDILLVLAGVTLAFTEPPEARKPSTRWRLYVFKDGEPLNGEICSTTVSDLLLLSGKMSPPSTTSVWLLCDSGCMHDYGLEPTIVSGMATSQLKLPRKSGAFSFLESSLQECLIASSCTCTQSPGFVAFSLIQHIRKSANLVSECCKLYKHSLLKYVQPLVKWLLEHVWDTKISHRWWLFYSFRMWNTCSELTCSLFCYLQKCWSVDVI